MIYTAIVGGKDAERTDGVKCFTENKLFYDPTMAAKIYKILSHRFIDTPYSVWVDGNIYPKVSEEEILKLMGPQDMAVFKHPKRLSYEDELNACETYQNGDKAIMTRQVEGYKKRGFEINSSNGNRLLAGGIIIRKNKPPINAMNEYWWAEICTKSRRDQLSLPWVIWKLKINCKVIEMDIRNNQYFEFRNHLIR